MRTVVMGLAVRDRDGEQAVLEAKARGRSGRITCPAARWRKSCPKGSSYNLHAHWSRATAAVVFDPDLAEAG